MYGTELLAKRLVNQCLIVDVYIRVLTKGGRGLPQ